MIDFKKLTIEQKERYLEIAVEQRFGKNWEDMKIKECLYYKSHKGLNKEGFNPLFNINDLGETVWNRNGCIYLDGKWAEPLEEELPESWWELERIDGWAIDELSHIYLYITNRNNIKNESFKNINATKEQAESSLAYAQLTQLLKAYNKSDEIDWNDSTQKKYVIYRELKGLAVGWNYTTYHPIAFLCPDKRDHFFKHHKELLKTYFQIKK